MKTRMLIASLLLLALPLAPAQAYDILAPRLHEAFTQAAAECLKEAQARKAEPTDCRAHRDRIGDLSKLQYALTSLQREVRWPDDPRREIKSFGLLRPAVNGKLAGCGRKIRDDRALQSAGLFCASHYGDLQFLHAMSSARPGPEGQLVPEDDATTRGKILAWAAFTYEVASGQVEPSDSYCGRFAGNANPIASSMVPPGFPFCITPDNPDGWTVGRLFAWRCGKIFIFFGRCTLLKEDPEYIRTVAKGALLHLVQDSYSQSHVFRSDKPELDETGDPRPRIECGKPRAYVAFTPATAKGHGKADKLPVWMESCDAPGAQDIITASAMVLHHLDEGTPTPDFLAYLERHIF